MFVSHASLVAFAHPDWDTLGMTSSLTRIITEGGTAAAAEAGDGFIFKPFLDRLITLSQRYHLKRLERKQNSEQQILWWNSRAPSLSVC